MKLNERIFLPESIFSADSLTVFTQPPCAIARVSICTHVQQIPNAGSRAIVGTHEVLLTLIGVGSVVLAAAVSYQVRRPEFPTRDKEEVLNYFGDARTSPPSQLHPHIAHRHAPPNPHPPPTHTRTHARTHARTHTHSHTHSHTHKGVGAYICV